MADGLLWFTDPGVIAQKLSVAADQLDKNVYDIVEEATFNAAERMDDIVMEGGVNATKKGGPRVDSYAMVRSIDHTTSINGRGRVQGSFGFIKNAPEYTEFQEKGTRYIPAMLAFAEAQVLAINELQNQFDSGKWFPTSLL